jgi:hypothetical protein
MITIKVADATGPTLDWLVAKAEGLLEPMYDEKEPRVVLQVDQFAVLPIWNYPQEVNCEWKYQPSTSWELGGLIIEREKISLSQFGAKTSQLQWAASHPSNKRWCFGETPLIAAMRCYVTSKLGETAEVPEELI